MIEPVSWDGHAINDGSDYRAGFNPADLWGLPNSDPVTLAPTGGWPVVTTINRNEVEHQLFIAIEDGSNIAALSIQLRQWLNPEDEESKEFVIQDTGATPKERYVNAICASFEPFKISGLAAYSLYKVTLVVDGDVRWRDTSLTTVTWELRGAS